MKVNLTMIPTEGLKLTFLKEGAALRELVAPAGELDFVLEPVHGSFTVYRSHNAVLVEGRVETTVELACSRCLELVHLNVATDFHYTFLPAEGMPQKDRELTAEDVELGYYEGESIDLAPIIFEQIVLQIPMKVLCREDCRGLCPCCGANLNVTACHCPTEAGDPRFMILKKLKH